MPARQLCLPQRKRLDELAQEHRLEHRPGAPPEHRALVAARAQHLGLGLRQAEEPPRELGRHAVARRPERRLERVAERGEEVQPRLAGEWSRGGGAPGG